MKNIFVLFFAVAATAGVANAKGFTKASYATPQEAAIAAATQSAKAALKSFGVKNIGAVTLSDRQGSKTGKVEAFEAVAANVPGMTVDQKVLLLKTGRWKGYLVKPYFDPNVQ